MRFVAAGIQPRVALGLTALCVVLALTVALAQPRTTGKATYRLLCARCHGADGRGGEFAPDIVARAAAKSDAELGALIRQGVPALAFKFGYEPGSPDEKTRRDWIRDIYHKPSDDLKQPVDAAAAAQFNHVIANLLQRVANGAARPEWNKDSFFKRFAKPAL